MTFNPLALFYEKAADEIKLNSLRAIQILPNSSFKYYSEFYVLLEFLVPIGQVIINLCVDPLRLMNDNAADQTSFYAYGVPSKSLIKNQKCYFHRTKKALENHSDFFKESKLSI